MKTTIALLSIISASLYCGPVLSQTVADNYGLTATEPKVTREPRILEAEVAFSLVNTNNVKPISLKYEMEFTLNGKLACWDRTGSPIPPKGKVEYSFKMASRDATNLYLITARFAGSGVTNEPVILRRGKLKL